VKKTEKDDKASNNDLARHLPLSSSVIRASRWCMESHGSDSRFPTKTQIFSLSHVRDILNSRGYTRQLYLGKCEDSL